MHILDNYLQKSIYSFFFLQARGHQSYLLQNCIFYVFPLRIELKMPMHALQIINTARPNALICRWALYIYISGPSGKPAIELTVSLSMAAEAAVVHGRLLLPFLLLVVASGSYDGARQPSINRRSFPHGFVFGTASSAYQVLPSCSVHCNQNGVMV